MSHGDLNLKLKKIFQIFQIKNPPPPEKKFRYAKQDTFLALENMGIF